MSFLVLLIPPEQSFQTDHFNSLAQQLQDPLPLLSSLTTLFFLPCIILMGVACGLLARMPAQEVGVLLCGTPVPLDGLQWVTDYAHPCCAGHGSGGTGEPEAAVLQR